MTIRAFTARGLLGFLSVPLFAQLAAAPPPPPAASVSPAAAAETSVPPTPATAAFDVADVHVSPFDRNLALYSDMQGGNLKGDRYIWRQATMTQLIATAYGFEAANVQAGPSWLDWDHFDIEAKAPPTTPKETVRLMLQSLLVQRFGLVLHRGTAPMPAFILTADAGKTKLKASEGSGDSGCRVQPSAINQGQVMNLQIPFICRNETMEQFAEFLRMLSRNRPTESTKLVIDSTGLKGGFDFDFKVTPTPLLARAGSDGISIFDAVDKELGLKLTLGTAPLPVLIVDSVKVTPTPNPPDLAQRMPPLPPPQFEVAVIKPSKPGERINYMLRGDEVEWQAISIKAHILFAWDLNFNEDESLAGAPKWLGVDTFDILGKLPDDSGGSPSKPAQLLQEELQQMLRGLLEDRFKMKYHWETRPIDSYHLVAVNPKLTPADPKARTRCDQGPGPDGKDPRLTNPVLDRLITCQNIMRRSRFSGEDFTQLP